MRIHIHVTRLKAHLTAGSDEVSSDMHKVRHEKLWPNVGGGHLMQRFTVAFALVCMILFVGWGNIAQAAKPAKTGISRRTSSAVFTLKSAVFGSGKRIPAKYTCTGTNISPKLEWSGVPLKTRSFVMLCEDPDAPTNTWIHWVLYNIPPTTRSLPEAAPADPFLADGSINGVTSFMRLGYGGPCPPPGKAHRYYFHLFALDTTLARRPGLTRDQVRLRMRNHILAKTYVMGRFSK
jgi:Raf kinase inhibitor-like YbhB/YbcL family protein